jgi:rhodanese-related sulfurtransferase
MTEFTAFLSQNAFLSIAFVASVLMWMAWEIKQLNRGFLVLTPAQLVEWMNRKEARVLDLAGNNDFLKMHIDGAQNVPLDDFSPEHKALKALKAAAERPIVVYDRAGVRAEVAAAQLVKAGFKQVATLDGGLDAWLRESLPTAKGR